MTIVYKSSIDIFLYVVGSSSENEVNFRDWVTRRVCSGLEMGYEGWLLVLAVGLGGKRATRMSLSAIVHIRNVP